MQSSESIKITTNVSFCFPFPFLSDFWATCSLSKSLTCEVIGFGKRFVKPVNREATRFID